MSHDEEYKGGMIYVFNNLSDLKKNTKKTEFNGSRSLMDISHYRRLVTTHDWGCRTNYFQDKHAICKTVEDGFVEADDMRRNNIQRYIEQYNERHPELLDEEELKKVSLFLTDNHRRGLSEYHSTSNEDKYRFLRCIDEPQQNLYYGIELEITFDDTKVDGYTGDRYDEYGDYDEEGDYDDEGNYIPDYYSFDVYSIAREFANRTKGLGVIEKDGSLAYGYSFEWISRALSFKAWNTPEVRKIMEDALDWLKEQGALINQPSGNGLHIHISRRFFEANNSESEVERAANDMNWIFQKYQKEIEQIGGRLFNNWCATEAMDIADRNRYSALRYTGAEIVKDMVKLPYADHRRAFIHSNSGNTYEARVFHSTLDFNKILAYIEFMRDIAHGARDNALEGKTFSQIIKYKKSPNLDNLVKGIRKEQREKKQKMLSLTKKNTNSIKLTTK